MIEKHQIDEHLAKTFCYRCKASLEGAQLIPISEIPVALIAHVVCPKCRAESMITISFAGSGTSPFLSDLTGSEMSEVFDTGRITYNDLLDLHQILKKENICNLLLKTESNLEKNQKTLEKSENFLQ